MRDCIYGSVHDFDLDYDSSSFDEQVMDEAKMESTASKVSPSDAQVPAALVFSSAVAKVKLESDGV